MSSNPVVFLSDESAENGAGFYWYDETWSQAHGPYNTEEEAREAVNKYAIEELGLDIPSSDGVDEE